MTKVLLIQMPLGSLHRPALGISLLKARLEERGIACDIHYLNFPFAEFVGSDEYEWLASDVPFTAWAGEWIFTPGLYGPRPEADRRYIEEVLYGQWRLEPADVGRILRMRRMVTPFLDHCFAAVPWDQYAVVGFTSTFEQNIASLALARRIKAAHPRIAIVFGGANWEEEMGHELHRRFPFVDYACSGEAEVSFPALVQKILAEGPGAPAGNIPGVVYRAGDESIFTGPPAPIQDLDELPIPDFADYFRDLSASTVSSSLFPVLLLETSRGCWWGQKSQCMFCGLNGANLHYRSKSAQRALDELTTLVERWRIDLVEVVDNMLDLSYFDDFLPALATRNWPVRLFVEVKANLSKKQVRLLKEAGVDRIQPGIESLSDHVLGLMRKGTTALRNIQLLKWCKQYGIQAHWNLLYGFPGETREDYRQMLELLPAVRFLGPPPTCGPMRMDRFNGYFNAPWRYGLTNVRPMSPYKYLYPFDDASLSRIAYCFDYDYAPRTAANGFADEVAAYSLEWKCNPETGTLSAVARPDGTLVLLDSRSDAMMGECALGRIEREAYEFCDAIHAGSAVVRRLHECFPGEEFSDRQVIRFLDSLVANRLMVSDGVHYLSLAIPAEPPVNAEKRPG
jgi:ribosomal peptide maturation radical SAM protein 1